MKKVVQDFTDGAGSDPFTPRSFDLEMAKRIKLGTAAMVHCGAKVNDPIEQAVWGPVEVFLDTVFICSVTGIAIVLSGLWNSGLDGAVLTMRAFDQLLPGGIGGFICLASVVLFGFSCLISYYTYAERAGEQTAYESEMLFPLDSGHQQ